jgi:uncharacterized lipoprotein YddW (UPF0748 family)
MNKRAFLKSLGLGTLGAGLGGLAYGEEKGPSCPPVDPARPGRRPRPTRNGIWITKDEDHTPDEWKRIFERMRTAGVDGILPALYDGRHAYYDSRRLPVKVDRVKMLVPLAREAGLEVHAWIRIVPCEMDEILKKHPDWYTVNAKGESTADKPPYVDYYKFLEPGHPEVRGFLRDLVAEVAAIPDIAGVHLDYIRYPDAILPRGLWAKYGLKQDRVYPEFDYGYSPHNRETFRKKCGVDPLAIKAEDAGAQAEWHQYRLDQVTELVNDYLVPAAHAHERAITAAVFPGPTLARTMVMQDWSRWKLNAFFPMLYHNYYEADLAWIKAQAREAVSAVNVPVCAGLFAGPLDFPEMAKAVRAALEGGASGVCLFSLKGMTEEKWMGLQVVIIGQR